MTTINQFDVLARKKLESRVSSVLEDLRPENILAFFEDHPELLRKWKFATGISRGDVRKSKAFQDFRLATEARGFTATVGFNDEGYGAPISIWREKPTIAVRVRSFFRDIKHGN